MERAWEEIYRRVRDTGLALLAGIEGVALGFHSVIDAIKRIRPGEIEAALEADPALRREVLDRLETMPVEAETPADVLIGLLASVEAGRSLRLVVRNEEIVSWLMAHFGYDRLRLGGTSGCMANALAPLGIRRVLIYANPLTRELAELFGEEKALVAFSEEGRRLVLKPPREAYAEEGIRAIHWALEYPEGLVVRLEGRSIRAPRTNRFYPCWNPVIHRLQLSETFKRGLLERVSAFSHMIVAGYQGLSPEYPDGTTCVDHMLPSVDYLRQLKRAKPDFRIHLECDTMPSDRVRRGLLEHVVPNVDSVGLNEVELGYMLSDLGISGGIDSPAAVLDGLHRVLARGTVRRVQFHTFGYYVCMERPGGDPERTRSAMALAALLAAGRARTGELGGEEQVREGMAVPLSREGMEAMRRAKPLVSSNGDFFCAGIGQYGDCSVIFVPTRLVSDPVLTVGLGDTISAVSFLAG